MLRRRYGDSPSVFRSFRAMIYAFYERNSRDFPWRRTRDPYEILVSEFMLQQTQTARVKEKYGTFLRAFPSVGRLASASRGSVLKAWQGLGYNRRAVALHATAQLLARDHGGKVPRAKEKLLLLPGVGPSTSSAIRAFAFNDPDILIETNIRRVFLHHFFPEKRDVRDAELIPYVQQTLDNMDPRHWYYALMDYGVYLSGVMTNPNRRSAHYARQAPFKGSNRQLRGAILRAVLSDGGLGLKALARETGADPAEVRGLVRKMTSEGLLSMRSGRVFPA